MRMAKLIVLFAIGGMIYMIIEIVYRGYTHQTMFFVGGSCFITIDVINRAFGGSTNLITRIIVSSAVITTMEFVAGCILNLRLEMGIWDYSRIGGNLLGQISLPFAGAWMLLSAVGILIDNLLNISVFKEVSVERGTDEKVF